MNTEVNHEYIELKQRIKNEQDRVARSLNKNQLWAILGSPESRWTDKVRSITKSKKLHNQLNYIDEMSEKLKTTPQRVTKSVLIQGGAA